MPVYQLVSSTTGVVSLADAKAHLREDPDVTDHDAVITDLVAAAEDHVRMMLGRALLPEVWTASFDQPGPMGNLLIDRPVNGISKVELLQGGSYVVQDASSYVMRPRGSYAALVRPAIPVGQTYAGWPPVDTDEAAYRVTFSDGWENAASVPASIVAAIKMIAGDMHTNRDGSRLSNIVDNPAVPRLLAPWRVPVL